MEVDFNNLRRKTLHAYDSLVRKLNARITNQDTTVILTDEQAENSIISHLCGVRFIKAEEALLLLNGKKTCTY